MLLQNEHDLVLLLGAAAVILLVLSIMGGVIAALKSFQVRQFQDLLFKAERKIDTLERRMFHVLNAVPVALVETDATGKFTFANKAAHQLVNRKDNELLGLRFHSATWGITYPDGRVIPADLLPIARTLRGQTVKGFQHLMTRYGTQAKVLVSVTSMPVMNSVGEVIGATAALVELETARGEGIDDLNGLWRGHWFEAASLPFWGLDAGGRIVDINAAACAAFGIARDKALGDNWAQDFVADRDFQAAMDYLARIQDGPAGDVSVSLTLRAPETGAEAAYNLTAWRVRTQEGGEQGLTVMAQPVRMPVKTPAAGSDVSDELADLRQTEQARAALGIGVWHYDSEADTIVEDAGLRRLIGRETEGGPTRIADADQARADAAFGELMSGARDEISLDMPVAQTDGGTRWITLRGRADTGEDGQRRLFGVAYDITPWHDASPQPVPSGIREEDHRAALDQVREQTLATVEAQHRQAIETLRAGFDATLADALDKARNEARTAIDEAFARGKAEAEAAHADHAADRIYDWHDAPPIPAPEPRIIREPDPANVAENDALKAQLALTETQLADLRAARDELQLRVNDLLAMAAAAAHPAPDPRIAVLEAELAAARTGAEALQARLSALETAPPPEPDFSAHDARIQALEADLSESRSLLAALERRYVALAETPPPEPDYSEHERRIATLQDQLDSLQKAHGDLVAAYEALANTPRPEPDVSEWRTKVAAAQARAAKLQAAFDAAQAELQTRPAIDPETEARLSHLQEALDKAQGEANDARARLDQLSEALSHAQRFETVGRLTADVAQDFAQMLGVINGALEVMASQPDAPDNLRRLSEAALTAGKRGERLTRQLQAFQSEEF